jgi:hypothetical protein
MANVQELLDSSKAVEHILRSGYRARGRGLTELALSVRPRLPVWILQALKTVATFRNQVAHDPAFTGLAYHSIPDGIVALCKDVLRELTVSRPFSPESARPGIRVWREGAPEQNISAEAVRLSEIVSQSEQLLERIKFDFVDWANGNRNIGDEFRKDYEFPDNEGVSENLISLEFLEKGWVLKIESAKPSASAPPKSSTGWLKTVSVTLGVDVRGKVR